MLGKKIQALGFLFLLTSDPGLDAWAGEGNCAHAAVADSIMIQSGSSVEISSVVQAFPDSDRGESPVSITSVNTALERLGYDTTVVKLDSTSPNDSWRGGIFLLFAGQERAGHFVVCKDYGADRIIIMDSDYHMDERVISTEQLGAWWDGTAVIHRRRAVLRVGESLGISCLFAAIILFGYRAYARRRSIVASALLPLCCLLYCSGCRRVESTKTVAFSPDLVRLTDLIEGETFVLRVEVKNGDDDLIVKDLVTSCSCMKIMTDLVGDKLAAGSTTSVDVEINPTSGDVVGGEIILISTSGVKAAANISGIVARKLSLERDLLIVDPSNPTLLRGRFIASRTKAKGCLNLVPDTNIVHTDVVSLRLLEITERAIGKSRVGGELVLEEHHWEYEIDDTSVGTTKLALPYDRGELFVTFRMVARTRMFGIPKEAYLGVVSKGDDCSIEFSPHGVGSAFESKTEGVLVEILDSIEPRIKISFVAPSASGKFTKTIDLEIMGVERSWSLVLYGEVSSD